MTPSATKADLDIATANPTHARAAWWIVGALTTAITLAGAGWVSSLNADVSALRAGAADTRARVDVAEASNKTTEKQFDRVYEAIGKLDTKVDATKKELLDAIQQIPRRGR